jgi:hypothetical protein
MTTKRNKQLLHENNLDTVQEELVGLLQEEAAEIIQELSKIRRTGTDFCRNGKAVPNKHFVQKEIIDFLLLVEMAEDAGLFDPDFDADGYVAEKLERLKLWTNLPHSLIENM